VSYKNNFFLVQHEFSTIMNVVVNFYYEEVLDKKFKSIFTLQAFMDKVMDQV
jgi:hypothetical protein